MHTQIIVNLPVVNVARSRDFFAAIGYSFDERMSNDRALLVRLGASISTMLIQRDFYQTLLLGKNVIDAQSTSGCVICLSVDSRDAVDALVGRALAAGASAGDTDESGAVYDRSFFDLDGHGWQIISMDPMAR
ncbi:VOC family protein [Cumulibacter soli]|uniref:VOC family protein n=1 Tax=Cumulibacter soli TaxID=2546344 RepID=UPI001067E50D|nr:glyoxalase [Cumulibacter soli]